MSTRPGRDHSGQSSCIIGGNCFRLLCFGMALAGRPPQPCCRCSRCRCTCINFAVVEDSLAELDLYPPPCLFGMLGICKAVSIIFDCLSRSAGPSKKKKICGTCDVLVIKCIPGPRSVLSLGHVHMFVCLHVGMCPLTLMPLASSIC